MTFELFLALVADFIGALADGIALFMTPPLVWFVGAAFATVVLGAAKSLIPSRRKR